MTLDAHDTLGRAIAAYAGRRVLKLEAFPDPHGIRGHSSEVPAFAVRATLQSVLGTRELGELKMLTYDVDFLVRVPLQQVTAADLEECEFTCWPPESK